MKITNDKNKIIIAGVQLSRCREVEIVKEAIPSFIYEKGTAPYNNLQQLALAVSCNSPVLLRGPVGSGKTSTVEYLASMMGLINLYGYEYESRRGFIKVQLGEQTDSKMLLGGYQSTEIPGEFIWKPGVLTNAVINGHWLLLEDIDSASSDVITVINNLIKNQSLSVPGFGDNIIPHSGFQLFATQRTLGYDSSNVVKCEILKDWFVIQLSALNSDELVGIISKKFPSLSCIAVKMVSILNLDYPVQSCERIPSARDILKWCNRCSKYFESGNFDLSLRVFQDAVELFCGHMSKDSKEICEKIGLQLGIVKNKAFFLSDRYKPSICITENKLIAGRISLERRQLETPGLTRSNSMKFALTAPCSRVIEKIASCLDSNEPVLLVGETGCGKTSILQYMARILGRNLIVINMNQQSDTSDLVGGFKPVTFRWIMKPVCDKFESLFRKLYDAEKNRDCLNKFVILFNSQNWHVLLKFINYVQQRTLVLVQLKLSKHKQGDPKYEKWNSRLAEWEELGEMVKKYTKQCEVAARSLVFSFIEGSLVKAVKRGDWVLLDEINLATSETLDCLSGLLEDSRGSLLLLEKGDSKPIIRNSGFRLFAAMNPATDVGKKRLPVGLRNRFTEFYIEELENALDLYPLVEAYLTELNYPPERIKKIVKFYLQIKKDSKSNILDGNGKRPHYSLRNLCRALTVASKNLCGNPPRSLYEGLNLSFLTQLDNTSYVKVHELVCKTTTDIEIKALLNQPIPKPSGRTCIEIEGFWIPVGNVEPFVPENYILTKTVKRHLKDVIRIISLGGGIPILLEGDTSVGKTSLINYLAKRSGNFCARVNNHEHTDIQEYIGTYVADSKGKLIFKEGILCEAMRKGYWLILDELNLAPSEVLEALNRVLDDNRELYIPETQTVIKAHEKFMLFATQNPTGLYGGRKELSRAFRNRFIELQFGQIPSDELITILEKRCQLPPSYCKKMVAVMTDLQLRRRGSEIFIGKSGFITLRDLFRWGERYQKATVQEKVYDWDQHLADEGYILLSGRVRLQEESAIIEEVISKHFKRKTNPQNLFLLHENTSPITRKILENIVSYSKSNTEFSHVVWTYSMSRLAVLVCKAIDFTEPVLLVGETGCGKTTMVQILALAREQKLYSVNCHTHSESSDFLGGLRPVREEARIEGKLFEWCDGPLVQAMKNGSFFLADEISLADDSVLERLNSLLEPERTILLTEKGGELIEGKEDDHVTVADKNFQFFGTMNPGGDYGKKELSPALRNRFTEIWVEVNDKKWNDYQEIIKYNLKKAEESLKPKIAKCMVDFLEWFQKSGIGKKLVISVRDLMTWVDFMNASSLKWFESCLHGCCLTFLDGLGCGSVLANNVEFHHKFRMECFQFLVNKFSQVIELPDNLLSTFNGCGMLVRTDKTVGIHPFYISRGKYEMREDKFFFNAPTTFSNTMRLLRGLQMNKGILLEGSPGVGKTSLVSSLAEASGHILTRINLSDQTDISDLFGCDLPEEGAGAGRFIWRDGPFLTALKNGHWILLDELNLALQSVLEGLNAVLDHRGSVFIPELNKTFHLSKETKLFACQNPVKEGGNRRGLPKSLLNRFIQVYVEPLTTSDHIAILNYCFPEIAVVKVRNFLIINKMVEFNWELSNVVRDGKVGASGGPWEFNLRDLTRWVQGLMKVCTRPNDNDFEERLKRVIFDYANLIYFSRFRSRKDVDAVVSLFESFFGFLYDRNTIPRVLVTEKFVKFGDEMLMRNFTSFHGDLNEFEIYASNENKFGVEDIFECREIVRLCRSYRGKKNLENLRLLEKQYSTLKLLSQCVGKQWLPILVGDHGTGKTFCVRVLAALANKKLRILSCNSAMDTTEILGGFEQTDFNRHLDDIAEIAREITLTGALRLIRNNRMDQALILLNKWSTYGEIPVVDGSSPEGDISSIFVRRVNFLNGIMTSAALLSFDAELRGKGEKLSERLQTLKKNLEEEKNITSGGKFEWVDSVLIKCIMDGSWLLMEDVNLCSSAVLDRLNSLLEPNGCLTVGERGANSDGSVFTVSPHPDFRLFFTMNPKNGPLSRAMRNRGVEIYLASDEEDWPIQDKLSLLSDVGIGEMAMQKALMKFESSRKTFNVSNLVSNGFWTMQYIRHGFGKAEAFQKSTQQVYKISKEEEFQLVEELSVTVNSCQRYSISYSRPPLCNFFIDDGYARLKQSCAFLLFLTEVVRSHKKDNFVPVEDLTYFLGSGFENCNLKLTDGFIYSVLFVYMVVSGPSIALTKKIIFHVIKDVPFIKDTRLMQLVDSLDEVISEDPIRSELIQLPLDWRWYDNPSSVTPGKNRIVLLLKFVFLLFRESRVCLKNLSATLKKKENVTVAEYSKAVEDGFLEDIISGHPVFANYNLILKFFDDFIVSCTKSSNVDVLDDAQFSWLLSSFKWRFWLGTMGNSDLLIGPKRTVNEDTLTHVDMYLLWFSKLALDGFQVNSEIIKEKYGKFTDIMKQSLRSEMSLPLLRISNIFRRSLGHPPPNKYLPTEGLPMNVEQSPSSSYQGDVIILKTVLNNIVQCFHTSFIRRAVNKTVGNISAVLSKFGEELIPLKTLVEICMKDDKENYQKLSCEVMYHALRELNSEYHFHDSLDDTGEENYLKQALIFHRPVWTCRVIHFLFLSTEKWNMINYKNSIKELHDITATILPQASLVMTPGMDPRHNEYVKLSVELNRVKSHVRNCLGADVDDLTNYLDNKSREDIPSSDRNFYEKISTILKSLSNIIVNVTSSYTTFGSVWVLLGFLELIILQGTRVDPVRKKLLKAKCARAEMEDLEAEIKTFEINSKMAGTIMEHPYLENLKTRLELLKRKVFNYNNLESVKRDPEKFKSLTHELNSYLEIITQVISLCSSLTSAAFDGELTARDLKVFYGKTGFIRKRNNHFINILSGNFIDYFGDLTYPLLAAAAQIENGMNMISCELLRKPFSKDEIQSIIHNFCMFPVMEEKDSQHPLHLLNVISWHPRIKMCLDNDKVLLLFSACSTKFNEWLAFKTKDKYDQLIGIFRIFITFWKQEEERRREKEMEKESLYLKRGTKKCMTANEEEQLEGMQSKLFPTYGEDFEEDERKEEELIDGISPEQLSQISGMHMKIVNDGVKFIWIENAQPKLVPDYLTPLRLRYLWLSHILCQISFVLDYNADKGLLPGLLPLMYAKGCGILSNRVTLLEEDDNIYDFYNDKNIAEANKCLDFLNELKVRVTFLLEQWPDHPALIQINVVIDRIMSFSVESPIMKFLTGLELLLQSCQHWESVAHSGVSIAEYLVRLTNLIIEWRKSELQGWKNCFEIAHLRMKKKASKWWYYIWSLVEEYLNNELKNEEPVMLNDVVKTIYNFIESSPLGEYEMRLDIIFSFHCHLVRLDPMLQKRDELAISLWNLYTFYSQYKTEVAKKFMNLTAPVVKKLKDYVKIAKWNDITYWSVKQAIDKSHRTLAKYIKEYEDILKQPVQLNTIDLNNWTLKEKNASVQDINQFLKPIKSKEMFKNLSRESLSLSNPNKKFEKAKKFCTDIILAANYPILILTTENFSRDICEGMEHFSNLDVDRTLPKEQQKGHARSIVHQKRRALADLFKTLNLIGLSYRTGLSMKEFNVSELCDSAPVILAKNEESEKLCGEDYYLKTVSKKIFLENSLLTPSKEIGPPIIDRMRGYSSHFIHLNKKQKFSLTKFEFFYYDLKKYLCVMSDLASQDFLVIPDQGKFRNNLLKFKEILSHISYTLEQFSLILNSWPTEGEKLKEMNFLENLTPEILISSTFEDAYLTAKEKFDNISKRVLNLKISFETVFSKVTLYRVKFVKESFTLCEEDFSLYSWRDVEKFIKFINELRDLMKSISEFRLIFEKEGVGNCLVNSLTNLESLTWNDFHTFDLPPEESIIDLTGSITKYLNDLLENVLLIIQKMIKKFTNIEVQRQSGTVVVDAGDDESERGELLDNHLTKSLIEALHLDFEDLRIDQINNLILSLMNEMKSIACTKGYFIMKGHSFGLFNSVLPFIEQYSFLCSYFLQQQRLCYRSCNKLSSILTGVFIQIAQKGFCIPPEYEEEEGEACGDQGGGGMGLADGEGEKDVSDRIESEDQLEGAEIKGMEKEKQEERHCNEEEKGIEMSDDFDGKTQDIEKEDVEDENEEEEGMEELDVNEMGDTEEGADKLEKELWSSEDEGGEDEEEGKKEEMGSGKGKQTMENEYAGKENEGEREEEAAEVDERKNKEKDKMDEINEQDHGDQIDPYHGHFEPELEPEAFELPDNFNLDDEGDKEEEGEENPFEIDAMKEVQPPNEIDGEEEEKKENGKDEPMQEDSTDGEEDQEKGREIQDEMMEADDEKMFDEFDIEKKESATNEETEEKGKENEEEKSMEEFIPSDDTPSTQPVQPAPESEKDEFSSKDQVVGRSDQREFQAQAQDVAEKPREEYKGTGQADLENMSEGHEVGVSNKEKLQPGECKNQEEKYKKERPGKSDTNRSLAENDLNIRKKLKTLDKTDEDRKSNENNENNEEDMDESEVYQHVKETMEKAAQVIDAATQEQAESQAVPNKKEEDAEDKIQKEEEIAMDVDDEEMEKEEVEEMNPTEGHKMKNMKKIQKEGNEGEDEGNEENQIEGEIVETMTVERGFDTTYHTQTLSVENERTPPLEVEEVHALRIQIQQQLEAFNQNEVANEESIKTWHLLNSVVEELSRDLTEQLRLILEPTKATRLKGDYRTGRRINMRKVISYIASEFRKDNIWLRRMKPWKREHEIVLAIDDSSSMSHNNSKELAFEALALVSKALSLLEAGHLGVLSFGEKTKIIHRLEDPFTEETGAKLLQEFTFCQNKTLISEMLDVSSSMMTLGKRKGEVSQLLIIISDGRGVFSEGLDKVKLAVRRASEKGIFIVFVIVDEPMSKDSIMDIRMPEFKEGKFLGIKSYLEEFPFPYYLILRDIVALPRTLGDALRQWFQLISSANYY